MKQEFLLIGMGICLFFSMKSIDPSAFQKDNKWEAPKEANLLKNVFKDNSEATVKGKKIYQEMCWTCHGKTGKGDGPVGVTLEKRPADHTSPLIQSESDGSLYWKISTGKAAMPNYALNLTEEERWALVNYIRMLGKK